MDRRDFLKTTGAVATVAAAGAPGPAGAREPGARPTADGPKADATPRASPSVVSATRTLVMASPWPEGSAGFADSATRLARRIGAVTAGRIHIETVAATGSGLEAVLLADADLYHGSDHHHLGFERGLAFFAGLPFFAGLEPADLVAWLRIGSGQDLWDDIGDDLGIKPLLAGHTGRAPGLWTTRPIDAIADLTGAGLYVPGLAAEVARDIGAEPIAVPAAGLANALATGAILGAEWGGALASSTIGLPDAARFHTGLGFNTSGSALTLGIRRATWDILGDADRAAIEACCAEETALALAEVRAHEAIVREGLTRRLGAQFGSMPGPLMNAISVAADRVVADLPLASPAAARVHASYMGFREAMTGLEPPRVRARAVV